MEKRNYRSLLSKNGHIGTRTEEGGSTPETELEESEGPYGTPW